MQYLLHWIFGSNFDGVSLKVRLEFLGCGYQCQVQLFHLCVPLFYSPQSSAAIVDWLLHLSRSLTRATLVAKSETAR